MYFNKQRIFVHSSYHIMIIVYIYEILRKEFSPFVFHQTLSVRRPSAASERRAPRSPREEEADRTRAEEKLPPADVHCE